MTYKPNRIKYLKERYKENPPVCHWPPEDIEWLLEATRGY
jgi:hypothetical protein